MNYVPLVELFNDAEKVLDRNEGCVSVRLRHLSEVISKLNEELGK
jgi:hypothetical protein